MAPISDMDAALLCLPHHSDHFSLEPRMHLTNMVTAHWCHSLQPNLLIHFWMGLAGPFVCLQMTSPHGVHQVWYIAFSPQCLFLLNCVCVCSVVCWFRVGVRGSTLDWRTGISYYQEFPDRLQCWSINPALPALLHCRTPPRQSLIWPLTIDYLRINQCLFRPNSSWLSVR